MCKGLATDGKSLIMVGTLTLSLVGATFILKSSTSRLLGTSLLVWRIKHNAQVERYDGIPFLVLNQGYMLSVPYYMVLSLLFSDKLYYR